MHILHRLGFINYFTVFYLYVKMKRPKAVKARSLTVYK